MPGVSCDSEHTSKRVAYSAPYSQKAVCGAVCVEIVVVTLAQKSQQFLMPHCGSFCPALTGDCLLEQ